MHAFETSAYPDVQKTGSTYISNLPQRFCPEELLSISRHGWVGKSCDPEKRYFISVRNPLDQTNCLGFRRFRCF